MPNITEHGREVLLKVKEAILAEPYNFEMADFIAVSGAFGWGEIFEPQKNTCSTAACIAGHMVAIEQQFKSLSNLLALDNTDILIQARAILGIPRHTDADPLDPLFNACDWPSNLWSAYRKAATDAERAQVAAKAIDCYLAGGMDAADEDEEYDFDDEDEDEDEDDDEED